MQDAIYPTMPTEIWIVCITAKITDSRCSIAFDGSEVVQGHLYIPANSICEAIDAAEENCMQDYLQLLDVVKCIKYVKSEWQDVNPDASYSALHSILNGVELAGFKNCIHGTFYGEDIGVSWSHNLLEIS